MQQKQYTLTFENRENHLFVLSNGLRTRGTVTAMAMEIFDAALANNLSKVLIDARELDGRLGVLDSYLLVTEVFQNIRGKGIRKAAIVDEQINTLREWFLETVARNRGFNIRIFNDKEKALDWLVS